MTSQIQNIVSIDRMKVSTSISDPEPFYKFIIRMCKTIMTADVSQIDSMMSDVLEKCEILKETENSSSVQEMDLLSRVLCHSLKMGWNKDASVLLSPIEQVLDNNLVVSDKEKSSIKAIYCSLWNSSLIQSLPPNLALSMQTNAIKCLILSGELLKATDTFGKVAALCDDKKTDLYQLEIFYKQVFLKVKEHIIDLPNITDEVLCHLNSVLLRYSKCLFKLQKVKEFSTFIKEFMKLIENKINAKIKIALTLSLKLADYTLTVLFKKCSPQPLIDMLKNVKIIPQETHCQTMFVNVFNHMLDMTQMALDIPNETCVKIFNSCLTQFSDRFLESEVPKAGTKIFENVGKYVKDCAEIVFRPLENRTISVNDICSSIEPICSFINLKHSIDMKTTIYNIGIHFCNIGVICFKAEDYSMACKFLQRGIEHLTFYRKKIKTEEKISVTSQIGKKVRLMQDALRYSKKFLAAVQFSFAYLGDVVKIEDLIFVWVKCKRDAYGRADDAILKMTIKDVYEKYLLESDGMEHNLNIKINDLLVMELQELKSLNFDASKDQLLVSNQLSECPEMKYKVIGHLGVCEVLWRHNEFCENGVTAITSINKANDQLQQFKQENEPIWLQLSAEVSYWTYLCQYQLLHQKAKNEIESYEIKTKEQKQAMAVENLGDEPTSDVYNLGRFSSKSLYDQHESILVNLEKALYWMKVITEKKFPIERICDVLEMLMTIGNIFRLSLLLSLSVDSFSVVLMSAKQNNLTHYWIKAMIEILLIAPEVVNEDGVKELQQQLVKLENTQDITSDKLMALCGISSYYLKNSKVPQGVECLQNCFNSPFLQKNTMSSVAIHTIALYLASQYALLPTKFFPANKPFLSCPFLAFYSTRKSLALIHYMQESPQDNIQWPFKASWLHYMSCQWLGTVCSMSNDPRIGIAYVGQSLEMAEQQVLPLRVSKLYTLLTEFDVMCDEVQHSRVKLDYLNEYLSYHDTTHTKSSLTATKTDVTEVPFEEGSDSEDDGFQIKCITELLAASSQTNVAHFNKPANKLVLSDLDQNCVSPFVKNKKEVVFPELTFEQFLNCGVCSSPDLCEVVSDFCLLSAQVSSHDSDFPFAIRCIREAGKTLQRTKKLSSIAVKKLFQSLGMYFASEKVNFSSGEMPHSVYSDVHLRSMYYHAEILAINDNFKEAKNINYKALIIANNLKTVPNTFWIAKLLLQERTLKEALVMSIDNKGSVSNTPPQKIMPNKIAISKSSPMAKPRKELCKTKIPVGKNTKPTVKHVDVYSHTVPIKAADKPDPKSARVVPCKRTKQMTKNSLLAINSKTPENTTEALSLVANFDMLNIKQDKPKTPEERTTRSTRSRTTKENVNVQGTTKTYKTSATSQKSAIQSKLPKKNLRRL